MIDHDTPPFQTKRCFMRKAFVIMLALLPLGLSAIDSGDYDPEVNDRFSSGFPTAPVPNDSQNFIGIDFDWSSAGWAASNVSKGFGFISPQHYLVARHFGGAATINIFGGNETVTSGSQRNVTATTYGVVFQGQTNGDLSIGALNAPFAPSTQLHRSGVLDLNTSSTTNTPAAYNGLSVFQYGAKKGTTNSPRIFDASISSVTVSGQNHSFRTSRTDVELEDGDSGSPAFHAWTNPNGVQELLTIGNNAAITETENVMNFTGTHQVMTALNNIMTPDGFALRVEGNPAHTWSGEDTTAINLNPNWGIGGNPNATGDSADTFVRFDENTAQTKTVDVNTNYELRGIYFTGSAPEGFTIGGNNILTIGRGGIVNYHSAQQQITADLALGDHQYWDVGAGGLSIANIATNGNLLEIAGEGTAELTGVISGSGGLSISGAHVEITAINSYTGNTWVHDGTLNISGDISSSSLRIGPGGSVGGTGTVGHIAGSGSIEPGNSPGILTAESVDPSEGMTFQFEFTSTGSPDYNNPDASINDVLRLTGSMPFTQALSANNAVNMYLDVPMINQGDTFRGGFFTDNSEDFLASIANGTFQWFQSDPEGDIEYNGVMYSLYSGPLDFAINTIGETANFQDGLINGQVMEVVVIPEVGTLLLATLAFATALVLPLFRRKT